MPNRLLNDRYELKQEITAVGFRYVYRAIDTIGHRDCLIVEWRVPQQDVLQFKRQMTALQKAEHARIAPIMNYFEIDDRFYVVSGLPPGRPLSEWIGHGLTETAVRELVKDIGGALAACHEVGVIHRDVRPESVWMTRDGHAVLTNFNLAKLSESRGGVSTMAFMKGWGATNYAPIEQFAQTTDERADIYSLAATAYHALTGQVPTPAPERASGSQLPSIDELKPYVSTGMAQAITRGMSLQVVNRFSSMQEFIAAVAGSATLMHGSAKGQGHGTRTEAIGLIVIVLAVLIGMGGILAYSRSQSVSATGSEQATTAVAILPTDDALVRLPTSIPVTEAAVIASLQATPKPTGAVRPAATPTIALAVAKPVAPTSVITSPPPFEAERVITIGVSVQGRPLVVHKLGYGPSKRMLIGAIHGGYEWNTVALMTQTLAYLRSNPGEIPASVTLYILPLANPDGYAAGTDAIKGRSNANGVDLNRNWDYMWQVTATHGTRPVSAGSGPFSEPEARAMKDFIARERMHSVIFYHSAFSAVFSGADTKTTPKTVELAKLMANVTGYRYRPEGVPGQISTGDSIDYLSKVGIPAVEVELTDHKNVDWLQNLRGLRAYLAWDLPSSAMPTPPPSGVTPSVRGVPTPATPTPRAAYSSEVRSTCGQTYTVKPEETLSDIALKCGLGWDDIDLIVKLNDLPNRDLVTPGQVLTLP